MAIKTAPKYPQTATEVDRAYAAVAATIKLPASIAASITAPSKEELARRLDDLREADRRRHGRPPSGKVRVTMLIDPTVIAKFKATGKGWQAKMNDALAAAKV